MELFDSGRHRDGLYSGRSVVCGTTYRRNGINAECGKLTWRQGLFCVNIGCDFVDIYFSVYREKACARDFAKSWNWQNDKCDLFSGNKIGTLNAVGRFFGLMAQIKCLLTLKGNTRGMLKLVYDQSVWISI